MWPVAPREPARWKTAGLILQPSSGARRISKARIWKACQHCRLNRGMTSSAAAPIIVKPRMRYVAVTDESLHEPFPLVSSLRPEYRVHRQPCYACDDDLPLRLRSACASSRPE